MKFYQKSIDAVAAELQTNIKTGLSQENVKNRIKKYGKNKIEHKKAAPWWNILLRQFTSPLIFILVIAAIVSLLIGEQKDSFVIMITVFVNTILGFIQELRAERAAEALGRYEVSHCLVRRDGKHDSIDVEDLVPGDIVLLSAGMRVPADIRLFHSVDLTIEEALLTGESRPIQKTTEVIEKDCVIGDQRNMLFAGTFVVGGKGEGIVVGVGGDTELGGIADLISQTAVTQTPLQIKIKRFSWLLGILMVAICFFIALLGLFKGMLLYDVIMIGIALAVAAIPEGLLVSLTVILAIGMHRMLKQKALVRHLSAAETLGSVSVICADKTGTLTEGKMRVVRLVTTQQDIILDDTQDQSTFEKDDIQELLLISVLNNDVEVIDDKALSGGTTEIALFQLAQKAKIDIKGIKKKFPRIHETSFSSDLKYMVTIHDMNGNHRMIVKGAPEKIFSMSTNQDSFKKQADDFAKQGLRILAIAFKDGQSINLTDVSGLTCVGLFGMQDPLRVTALETVEELNQAGVRVVLVTGDHKETAAHIARQVGIVVQENSIITGQELEQLQTEDLYEKIESINVFARVEPKHKIRIVQAWQARGHSVAMTGDGINDAPALKAADIGVSVGSGSDVAHEISDVVLLDDNLSTISVAVREGRVIFDNIRKVITYLMSDSLSELILISVCLLVGLPLPILASQILWVNLIASGFPTLALTVTAGEDDIMTVPPRKKDAAILDGEMNALIFIIGNLINVGLLGIYFYYYFFSGLDIMHIRSVVFTGLAVSSLFFVFPIASLRHPLWRVGLFANPWLIASIVFSFTLQFSAIYMPFLQELFSTVPLRLNDWILILIFCVCEIIAIEITKFFFIIKKQ